MRYQRGLILSCVCGLILAVYYYLELPDEVAVHFGISGKADNYGSSLYYLYLNAGLHLALTLIMLFLPSLMHLLPKSLINLPNKDYWLSKGNWRKAQTILENQMAMFGIATNLFLMIAGYLSYQGNLVHPPRLDSTLFLGATILFLVFTVVWVVFLFRAFNVPEEKT